MKYIALPLFLLTLFTSFGQRSEDLIPHEASTVLSINNVNLLQKISLDELVQYRFMEELHHDFLDGSTAGWTLKDSGIDFDQKMNFFVGKEIEYEITGITFGVVDKARLFKIFDDFEPIESTISGVEMYASYFNRLAVKGNNVILFRIAPSYHKITDVTDSIWYSRGGSYNWDNSGHEEIDEEIWEEEVYEEAEITVDIEKNYYELLDSVETAFYEQHLLQFTDDLFVKGRSLVRENRDFATQMTSNSEGTYYVDNSANLRSDDEFQYMRNYYPKVYNRVVELYSGNVLSGNFYIDENTIKLDLTATYGDALGAIYEKLGTAKFDNHLLPYINKDNTAYMTANLNIREAYDLSLETLLSVLNASDRSQMIEIAMTLDLMNEFVDKDAMFDAMKGGAFMTYGGIQKVPIRKIVYEYDEETFDYIERQEIAEEDMPIFTFGFSSDRQDIMNKFLGYLSRLYESRLGYYSKQQLINHGDYWELTNGLFESVSLFMVNKNGVFVITNDAALAKKNSNGFGGNAVSKKTLKKARKGGGLYASADMNRAISELPREMFSESDNEMIDIFREKSGTIELTSKKSTKKSTEYALVYTFDSEEDSGTYLLDLINSLYVISK